jgi:hypothetical protein
MKTLTFQKTCSVCKAVNVFTLNEKAYKRWVNGESIQTCFPELSLNAREFLISGICGPCFDELFADTEE